MTNKKLYPFANGSQYVAWYIANCHHCQKFYPDQSTFEACSIDYALGMAYLDDGSVTPEIAQRMGFMDHMDLYCWPCGEVQRIPTIPEKAASQGNQSYEILKKQQAEIARLTEATQRFQEALDLIGDWATDLRLADIKDALRLFAEIGRIARRATDTYDSIPEKAAS